MCFENSTAATNKMTIIIEDFFSSFLTLMPLWQTPETLFPKIYSPKMYARSGHKLKRHQGTPYRLFYETYVTVRACHCVTNLKLSLCSRATFGTVSFICLEEKK